MKSGSGLRDRVPLPTGWEIWELAIQVLLLPLVVLPRSLELVGCGVLASIMLRPGSKYRKKMEARFPGSIERALAVGRGGALRQFETMLLRERVRILEGVLFPWWRQRVRLHGVDHPRAAMESGHDVILWLQSCLGTSLSVKQALFEAGFPLAHLTRPSHGFSPYPFGVCLINPVMRRAEDRFLAERVMIDEDRTVGPLRRIHALLRENRVVSITVTTTTGRVQELPLLDGVLQLPDGPMVIAAKSGAPILPVFCVRELSTPVVEIGPPLRVTGTSIAEIRAGQLEYALWLEKRIQAQPPWVGWRAGIFSRGSGETVPK